MVRLSLQGLVTCCPCTEMGDKLAAVDLGLGADTKVVDVECGGRHTCVLLVCSPKLPLEPLMFKLSRV